MFSLAEEFATHRVALTLQYLAETDLCFEPAYEAYLNTKKTEIENKAKSWFENSGFTSETCKRGMEFSVEFALDYSNSQVHSVDRGTHLTSAGRNRCLSGTYRMTHLTACSKSITQT